MSKLGKSWAKRIIWSYSRTLKSGLAPWAPLMTFPLSPGLLSMCLIYLWFTNSYLALSWHTGVNRRGNTSHTRLGDRCLGLTSGSTCVAMNQLQEHSRSQFTDMENGAINCTDHSRWLTTAVGSPPSSPFPGWYSHPPAGVRLLIAQSCPWNTGVTPEMHRKLCHRPFREVGPIVSD